MKKLSQEAAHISAHALGVTHHHDSDGTIHFDASPTSVEHMAAYGVGATIAILQDQRPFLDNAFEGYAVPSFHPPFLLQTVLEALDRPPISPFAA